jgi:hypothetical protein
LEVIVPERRGGGLVVVVERDEPLGPRTWWAGEPWLLLTSAVKRGNSDGMLNCVCERSVA